MHSFVAKVGLYVHVMYHQYTINAPLSLYMHVTQCHNDSMSIIVLHVYVFGRVHGLCVVELLL